jgi:hypothetical protein
MPTKVKLNSPIDGVSNAASRTATHSINDDDDDDDNDALSASLSSESDDDDIINNDHDNNDDDMPLRKKVRL